MRVGCRHLHVLWQVRIPSHRCPPQLDIRQSAMHQRYASNNVLCKCIGTSAVNHTSAGEGGQCIRKVCRQFQPEKMHTQLTKHFVCGDTTSSTPNIRKSCLQLMYWLIYKFDTSSSALRLPEPLPECSVCSSMRSRSRSSARCFKVSAF